MEFGIFIQGYVPKFRQEVDPDAEHHAFMDELEIVQAADKAGFKYVWVTEHHFWDLEMVRLMGEHVIPKIDTDPVHRTTRMREAAAAKL
jgi:alkanesulfonate monooxygenase SsuD/methylene tetrahydromethanopterin reductase-like flavin-dependent oxidoreductase (luciferase family)